MNQAELINEIAEACKVAGKEITKADIKFIQDMQGAAAQKELKKGGEITLPGIGKLYVDHKEARKGRNPKTGETIDIAAKNAPKFSASKALKDAIN